jgi:hypothetical protein
MGVEFAAALVTDRGAAGRRRRIRRRAKRTAQSIDAVTHPSCGEAALDALMQNNRSAVTAISISNLMPRFPSCSHAMAERE